MARRCPGSSRDLNGFVSSSAGAASAVASGITVIRMLECGQTIAHLPQSMQIDGSQIGIVGASARFSYWAVAVGNAPSGGIALTGRSSPLPAISCAVTVVTKSGTPAGIERARRAGAVSGASPSGTWRSAASDPSIAAKFRATTSSPRLA